MGILEGKNVLVAGVTMNTSIGYRVAEVAAEQGATVLVSNFGRALSLTRRIVRRLDPEPVVLELPTDSWLVRKRPDAGRFRAGQRPVRSISRAFGNRMLFSLWMCSCRSSSIASGREMAGRTCRSSRVMCGSRPTSALLVASCTATNSVWRSPWTRWPMAALPDCPWRSIRCWKTSSSRR